jgi:endonuclease/exonuclease/phosphatase family metal-dependent hydrolase
VIEHGPPAVERGTGLAQPSVSEMTSLRVASFNIRNGRAYDGWNSWLLRRRATAASIVALDADIVGLQEVYDCQRRYLGRQLPRYDAFGGGRDDGDRRGEACPVLIDRIRVRMLDHRIRWFGATPDLPGSRLPEAHHPRIATFCTIAVPGVVEPIRFVCAHLDTSRRRRAANVSQLASWLDATGPLVVVGDLNTRPDDPDLDPLWSAGLRSALPDDAPGTNHSFTGRTDGPRIDHILVSEHVEVVSGEVLHPRPGGRLPSDHWPVVAELRLRQGPEPTAPTVPE